MAEIAVSEQLLFALRVARLTGVRLQRLFGWTGTGPSRHMRNFLSGKGTLRLSVAGKLCRKLGIVLGDAQGDPLPGATIQEQARQAMRVIADAHPSGIVGAATECGYASNAALGSFLRGEKGCKLSTLDVAASNHGWRLVCQPGKSHE